MKELSWVFFNSIVPLLPVFVVWGIPHLREDVPPKRVFSIIKDGQVFFFCAALSSGALGELPRVPSSFQIAPWIVGFLTILVLSIIAFVVAAQNPEKVREGRFGWASVGMVLTAVGVVLSFRIQVGLL
ncbi:MAG: hypothetical protein KBE22_02495 [Candidatus Accumulibacter sp.]|uniref:Uncharacterized protein n=1 Tax=Candidatus Accumulibacter affinis TaxID=2954384 RepID=A0A935W6F0_9PROT|nr:hypothetical protein [Candidatus Accumulibacter affinis]MBP9803762.1 hypothetical protein [Accumulibacter sp.]